MITEKVIRELKIILSSEINICCSGYGINKRNTKAFHGPASTIDVVMAATMETAFNNGEKG